MHEFIDKMNLLEPKKATREAQFLKPLIKWMESEGTSSISKISLGGRFLFEKKMIRIKRSSNHT